MIPKLDEEIVPARSYGLMENVGLGRTAVDQSDGEDEYFSECMEMFPGDAGELV